MKLKSSLRALVYLALMLFTAGIVHAGQPLAPIRPGDSSSGIVDGVVARVQGSTATTVSNNTAIIGIIAAPASINSGGQTYKVATCLDRFVVQMSTVSVLTVADGATTVFTYYGAGISPAISGGGPGTLSLPEPQLEPLCFTPGNAVTFTVSQSTNDVSAASVNWEGYQVKLNN